MPGTPRFRLPDFSVKNLAHRAKEDDRAEHQGSLQ